MGSVMVPRAISFPSIVIDLNLGNLIVTPWVMVRVVLLAMVIESVRSQFEFQVVSLVIVPLDGTHGGAAF